MAAECVFRGLRGELDEWFDENTGAGSSSFYTAGGPPSCHLAPSNAGGIRPGVHELCHGNKQTTSDGSRIRDLRRNTLKGYITDRIPRRVEVIECNTTNTHSVRISWRHRKEQDWMTRGPWPQSDAVQPRGRDQEPRRIGSYISKSRERSIEQCPRYAS